MTIQVFDRFDQYCAQMRINSKEFGVVPLRFWNTQDYYLKQIQKGVEEGVRDFKTLKGRQGGITTVDMAIAIFWMNKYTGTLGAMITDDSSNLVRGRSIITQYMKSLGPNYHIGEEHHNIYELELLNLSVLSYLVAGKRKKTAESGDLGQGKGLNFLIATEVASWADEKQVDKLNDSLAEENPNRLYLWESTANGFNHWYDMCRDAKNAVTQRFIFIGWWLKELNKCKVGTDAYRVYWDGKLTKDEKTWCREIKQLYDFEITPEQIAWWRLQLHEKKRNDLNALYQEHPPTEEYAFIMSGYKFFSTEKLTETYKLAMKTPFEAWKYVFGNDFVDMQLYKTNAVGAMIKIWEQPSPHGMYAIGADPAYGYNPESDESVLAIYRCYSDRIIQVAEFCFSGIRTDQFAWVILHIAGWYRNVLVNLEITGPGQAVLTELRSVQKRQALLSSRGERNFADVLSCMKHFLYSRQDALTQSFNYHTKTTEQEKEDMLNNMKALFETNHMEIRSARAITEMKYFARFNGSLGGRGGENDDCVIASGLAILAYIRWIRPQMLNKNQTYANITALEAEKKTELNNHVLNYLAQKGVSLKQ